MSTRTSESTTIEIRPVCPTDRAELSRFYASLSADSRYARFLATSRGITDHAADSFCGLDHEHREGLVATASLPDRSAQIVGHLCLDPLEDSAFEMAVAVADGWRGQGIGRRLLNEAIDWASRHGVAQLRATMLATNIPILALIRSTGRTVVLTSPDCGVIEAQIAVPPSANAASANAALVNAAA